MQAALDHIVQHHAPFGPLALRVAAPPPLGTPIEPFVALVQAIAHQQLHGTAARAILARFAALFPGSGTPSPEQLLAADHEVLRGCGFSAGKIAALRDIAAHAVTGVVPTAAEAAGIDDETLIARLVAIRGVGRWTVQMVLISALGRPDVLPVDDFGVRDGWRHLNGLASAPTPRALAAIGAAWAPYRSTAAWYLWRASEEGKRVRS